MQTPQQESLLLSLLEEQLLFYEARNLFEVQPKLVFPMIMQARRTFLRSMLQVMSDTLLHYTQQHLTLLLTLLFYTQQVAALNKQQ